MRDRLLFFQALILIPKQEFLHKHNVYAHSSGVYFIIEAEALA